MSDGGKGSARRPAQVSDEQYAERWDQIFQRKTDRVNAVRDVVQVTPWTAMICDPVEIRGCFEKDDAV